MFSFTLEGQDGFARAGTFLTPHGPIQTPIFMPVGTRASVKGIRDQELHAIGTQIFLCNTYHIMLRPGEDLVAQFGGLHRFIGTSLPILTDSGGFQVFSLGQTGGGNFKNKQSLVKITEDGVRFQSHLDGSYRFLRPEDSIEIQSKLGADIIMAFDECAPGNSTQEYARSAMNRTHRWALRSFEEWKRQGEIRESLGLHPQALFPIIQGVVYPDLRRESCAFLRELETPGIAIGGLSVGESKEDMYHMLQVLAPELPQNKPHYLMGVGRPEDIIEGVYNGIDMFDCVLPTRLGRHSTVYTSFGDMRVSNEMYATVQTGIPMLPQHQTGVSKQYSLGYLRHLLKVGEALGGELLSLHNLEYLLILARECREAVLEKRFEAYRKQFYEFLSQK